MQSVKTTLKGGLVELAKLQNTDGSWPSFTSKKKNALEKIGDYKLTFPASLAIAALWDLRESFREAEKIIKKCSEFLLKERSPYWTFNYWDRSTKEAGEWPDDLDDTSCALAALSLGAPHRVDGALLANIVKILTALEVKPGGPYRTWVVDKRSKRIWKDVDLAVNCNVAFFLSLQGVELENITRWVEEAINEGQFHSPYYLGDYPVIYFISRFYKGKEREKLCRYLLKKRDGRGFWGSPLNTAMAATSFLRLGGSVREVKGALGYLAREARKKKKDLDYSFYYDPSKKGKNCYGITPALNLALILETLSLYEKQLELHNKKAREEATYGGRENKEQKEIRSYIIKSSQRDFKKGDWGDLGEEVRRALTKTLKEDKRGEIIFFPYFFWNSLGSSRRVDRKKLGRLGLLNLYGWTAYALYDDFLDNEGQPHFLPVANGLLMEVMLGFGEIFAKDRSWQEYFLQVMRDIEAANYEEVTRCRLKKEGNNIFLPNKVDPPGRLLDNCRKSMGHVLAPAAILLWEGKTCKSKAFRSLTAFFNVYLATRQLNDDLHDWEEDLKEGRLTDVGRLIIRAWQKRKKGRRVINCDKDFEEMAKVFWGEVIENLGGQMLKEIKRGRKLIEEISFLAGVEFFGVLLNRLEASVDEALKEKEKTITFLQNL